ncbi:MAG TPA: hypothetical protein PLH63_00105 [Candidatus Cloacimonadota bacterium]|nr:hypothetical protein [Candidatus Cloacimonadota bacterium]
MEKDSLNGAEINKIQQAGSTDQDTTSITVLNKDILNNPVFSYASIVSLNIFMLVFLIILFIKNRLISKKIEEYRLSARRDKDDLHDTLYKVRADNEKALTEIRKECAQLSFKNESFKQKLDRMETNITNFTSITPQQEAPKIDRKKELSDFLKNNYNEKTTNIVNNLNRLKSYKFLSQDDIDNLVNSLSSAFELSSKKNDILKPLSHYLNKYFEPVLTFIIPLIDEEFNKETMESSKILGENKRVHTLIHFGLQIDKTVIKKANVYVY